MTDHATESERFRNEYLRLRTPGRVPNLSDVLALANYHATMAVVDAVRGLTPNTAQDAAGDDLPASQPEPGQLDGGEAAEATGGGWSRNRVAYWEPPAEPLATYALPSKWALGASEPVPLGGGEATGAGEFADCPRCDRHLRAVQHFLSRAEKAEAEWDDALAMAAHSELDRVEEKDKADRAEAERDAILNELRKLASYASPGSITALLDRHTTEG